MPSKIIGANPVYKFDRDQKLVLKKKYGLNLVFENKMRKFVRFT